MPDFSANSLFNADLLYDSVVFGKGAPLLETELNLMQDISKQQIYSLTEVLGSFYSPGAINVSAKKSTSEIKTIIATGSAGILCLRGIGLIKLDTINYRTIIVTPIEDSTKKYVIFSLWKKTYTSDDTKMSPLMGGEYTMDTKVVDSRVKKETSRRSLYSYKFELLNSKGAKPSPIIGYERVISMCIASVDSNATVDFSVNEFTVLSKGTLVKTLMSHTEDSTIHHKVDNTLSDTSENPVQNKVVKAGIDALESEIAQQSTEMMDIKMLGWSVPKECSIQNELNGNQFIQKVGRANLGSLGWGVDSGRFYSGNLQSSIKAAKNEYEVFTGYLKDYINVSFNNLFSSTSNDKLITVSTSATVSIKNTSYTDITAFKQAMQGQYLYYELATPITTMIDGNEIGETLDDVRKETTVNLLNANQPSSVTSGVTKTNNGDGTYTIQGTATTQVFTHVGRVYNFETGVYKLTGTKVTSGNAFLYVNGVKKDGSSDYSILTENTKPISLIDKSAYTYLVVGVAVANGVTVDETIKPMITTNLTATYEDFVPYTGDTGSLNGDVANLRTSLDNMIELGADITD